MENGAKEERESVWDYPRPPIAQRSLKAISIVFADQVVVQTTRSIRVLETGHPPVYYIPMDDIHPTAILLPTERRTICEWKGTALHYHVMVEDFCAEYAAWSYCEPAPPFESIRDCVAFHAHLMDSCRVAGERVQAESGGIFGGWITKEIDLTEP